MVLAHHFFWKLLQVRYIVSCVKQGICLVSLQLWPQIASALTSVACMPLGLLMIMNSWRKKSWRVFLCFRKWRNVSRTAYTLPVDRSVIYFFYFTFLLRHWGLITCLSLCTDMVHNWSWCSWFSLTHCSLTDAWESPKILFQMLIFARKHIYDEITMEWMAIIKSTLAQVMDWCWCHYLSQCGHKSMSPYGIRAPIQYKDDILPV